MASSNLKTIQALHRAFNDRDWEAMAGPVAESCIWSDARGIEYKGPEAYAKEYAKGWIDAFSDGKITNPRYYDAGDTVVAEFVGAGTNDGPLGPMPATNRKVNVPYCEIFHFDTEGKVIRGSSYFDMFGLMVQLGHASPPG